MTKPPQRVDQFHNAVKAAGLYLPQFNRKSAATLKDLVGGAMTITELTSKYGPRHGLGICITHNLAVKCAGALSYEITHKGREYLHKLQSANLI